MSIAQEGTAPRSGLPAAAAGEASAVDGGPSDPGATARAGRREWIGLAVLALPTLLISIDVFVMLLTLPHLSVALGASSTEQLWIVDSYGFLLSGLLITMGAVSDRIGPRRLLLIGVAAFGVASVLAAYAPTVALLIVARALLGVAGADAGAVDPRVDQHHVPRSEAAWPGDRGLVRLLRGWNRHRPGGRWGDARVLLVGVGVPARCFRRWCCTACWWLRCSPAESGRPS
ncbi:hypothetical protein GCM10020369_18900 [Cryptosporangium minutisporangium]|uniref:Major facilitator superfamily (MFS) profile domain-containing protein n=1 Tax=Cryptosporangium minutisporangium TaxID=113569 RepID=A0ABP6SV32_9ACTN